MKALIQSMVKQALDRLAGIQERVSYQRLLSGSYDPVTGTVTRTNDTQSLNCVFSDYTLREMYISEGKIEKKDRKALILPSDFLDTTPTFQDTLTRENGETWKIVEGGIGLDPAEALYVLQVRQTDG